jgi:hypothetical protein
MGMTIDEVIKEMKEEYAVFLEGTGLDNQSRMEEERKNNLDCNRVCTANEITLDILRKYQKIVDIVSLNDEEFKQCGLKELKEILEVIANGNKSRDDN